MLSALGGEQRADDDDPVDDAGGVIGGHDALGGPHWPAALLLGRWRGVGVGVRLWGAVGHLGIIRRGLGGQARGPRSALDRY